MLNREKIITLVNEGNKALNLLKEYDEIDPSSILNSYKEMSVIKYQFIILIEASIDICSHISTTLFQQVAESYSQCFAILRENEIINPQHAEKLSEFAKFRNVIVHLYWKVDDELVLLKLKELEVFSEFFQTIILLTEEEGGKK